MLQPIKFFIGFLITFITYSGLIQYYDQGFINWGELIFNPRPWFVALFVGLCVFIWRRLKNSRKDQLVNDQERVGLS